jgi:dihydroneopterin aldolase
MMLRLLTRHGIEDEDAFKPQPFSLIVTISDPEKKRASTTRWRRSSATASSRRTSRFARRRG